MARIVSEEDEEDSNQTNATVEKIEIKDEEDTCKIQNFDLLYS